MRHAHLNFRRPSELSSKNLVYDLPKLNANTCETCLKGKQSRLAFALDMPKRSNDALKVVHFDICAFEVSSLGRNKYFITFLMNI